MIVPCFAKHMEMSSLVSQILCGEFKLELVFSMKFTKENITFPTTWIKNAKIPVFLTTTTTALIIPYFEQKKYTKHSQVALLR